MELVLFTEFLGVLQRTQDLEEFGQKMGVS